jgi:hypothetical protein
MDLHEPGIWIVLASEVVACWVILRLWRSADRVSLKLMLSLVALIPVLGPLLAIWISDFPDVEPEVLQVPRGRGYFFARWREVLETRNPVRRFRKWRDLMNSDPDEDP